MVSLHVKIKLLYCLILTATALLPSCSALKSTKQSRAATIKVMSYNVHHCNPPAKNGVIDIDAIASVINNAKPDIVGLQEIDVNTGRSGKDVNQAEQLAKKTGMYFFFGKAIDHDGGEYGIAILSKFPIGETKVYSLSNVPGVKGEPRVLVTAKLQLPSGKQIRFGNTHLDAGKDPVIRLVQMSDINAIAVQEKLPFLITGDFNARPDSEVIELMDKVFIRSCKDCPPTIPADNPRNSIDFIGHKTPAKLILLKHEVISAPTASDHLPVIAEYELK